MATGTWINGMKVLLAEDDTEIRHRIAKAIREAGHEVTVAATVIGPAVLLGLDRHDLLLIGSHDEAMEIAQRAEQRGTPSLVYAAHSDQMLLLDRNGIARYEQRFPIDRIADHLQSELSGNMTAADH